MLLLDGVYVEGRDGAELTALASRIASRVGRFLERQGLVERDAESTCLSELALNDEPMEAFLAHSITYRIAVGPRAGRKVFTLQSLPAGDEGSGAAAGKVGGFGVDAGVAARADERSKLERLCRYISRPAVSAFTSRRNVELLLPCRCVRPSTEIMDTTCGTTAPGNRLWCANTRARDRGRE